MNGKLVPGDHAFHDDKQLIADLTALTGQLSRYVLRHLDADAGRVVPTSPDDEHVLAEAMSTLASKVRERADRYAAASAPDRTVIEQRHGPDPHEL
jgi:hypothetical protein